MSKEISKEAIEKTKKVLIDNGIDEDEVEIVLQAIGYSLLDKELFPEPKEKEYTVSIAINCRYDLTLKATSVEDAFEQAKEYELDSNDFAVMDIIDTVPVNCYTPEGEIIDYHG